MQLCSLAQIAAKSDPGRHQDHDTPALQLFEDTAKILRCTGHAVMNMLSSTDELLIYERRQHALRQQTPYAYRCIPAISTQQIREPYLACGALVLQCAFAVLKYQKHAVVALFVQPPVHGVPCGQSSSSSTLVSRQTRT